MKQSRLASSIIILLCAFSINGFAQVGINTITPDSSASLHIVSKPSGSGLIIPELTEAQRLAIAKPAKGLMVFDLDANLFYMNMGTAPGNQWYAINPFLTKGSASTADVMYTSTVVTKIGIGTNSPQSALDVNGETHTKTLSVDGFSANALVPSGAIMMWSGDPAALPAGWALCDGATIGSFLTPDLRGRFIVGFDKNASASPVAAAADGTTINYGAVKNIGGEVGHTLLKAELPKHSHIIGAGIDGSSISNPGDHKHTSASISMKEGKIGKDIDGILRPNAVGGGVDTQFAGNHIHTGVTGDGTTDGLTGQIHENRPPYYVLAYIIKLP
ncbi:MAG: hypothetical protein ABI315_09850 [Bacteroidia bacterium]